MWALFFGCLFVLGVTLDLPMKQRVTICAGEVVVEDRDRWRRMGETYAQQWDEIGVFISNLNETCFRCLCHVVGCEVSRGCSDGYCGPFYISRVYWVDAGKPTLPDDDADRKEAFEDCAMDYHCSKNIIQEYMAKFGKDCNGDGVTNCYDYMMINYHGGRACSTPLFLSESGRRWVSVYQECRL